MSAPKQGTQNAGWYRFHLGDFECTVAWDGYIHHSYEGIYPNAAPEEMARLKSGEREGFEFALSAGRPITLKNLLRGLDGRRAKGVADKVTTKALVERVTRIEKTAIEAVDAEIVARLDAWITSVTSSARRIDEECAR